MLPEKYSGESMSVEICLHFLFIAVGNGNVYITEDNTEAIDDRNFVHVDNI